MILHPTFDEVTTSALWETPAIYNDNNNNILVSRGQTGFFSFSFGGEKKGLVRFEYPHLFSKSRLWPGLILRAHLNTFCNEKFGPGKNRSGRTIFSRPNLVRPDHF